MTVKEAKYIGLKKTMKSLLVICLIWEFLWLVRETSGDFANGILFYIENHLHYQIALIYLSILSTFMFFGRKAGKDMLISKKNAFITGGKYLLLTLGVIYLTIFGIWKLEDGNWNWDIARQLIALDVVIAIPIATIWALSMLLIRKVDKTRTEP